MPILLATRNDHKLQEIRAILTGNPAELRDLSDYPEITELPETGNTFVLNALEKARFVFQKTGFIAIADDSGLEVDALNGAPGVFSKRFSPEGTDAANNALLLQKLEGVTERQARYKCVIAVVGPGGEAWSEGSCEGTIAEAPKGTNGFGYDPLFLPDAEPGRSMAELSMAEKNAISHRARALVLLSMNIKVAGG